MNTLSFTRCARSFRTHKQGFNIPSTRAAFVRNLVRGNAHENAAYGSWDFDEARHASLHVDDQIKHALISLVKHTLAAHKGLCTQPGVSCPSSVAAAAVAAAEANGALPPLTAEQRQAFQNVLQLITSGMIEDSVTILSPSNATVKDAAEEDIEWLIVEEGAVDDATVLKPEFRRLLEELSNLNLQGGWRSSEDVEYKTQRQGGEVGNISVDSARHQRPEVIMPAEGVTERTEHGAEADFLQLEINAFEPHAKPEPPGSLGHAEKGVVNGDAPAAGDGMQVFSDSVNPGEVGTTPAVRGTKRDRPAAAEF